MYNEILVIYTQKQATWCSVVLTAWKSARTEYKIFSPPQKRRKILHDWLVVNIVMTSAWCTAFFILIILLIVGLISHCSFSQWAFKKMNGIFYWNFWTWEPYIIGGCMNDILSQWLHKYSVMHPRLTFRFLLKNLLILFWFTFCHILYKTTQQK